MLWCGVLWILELSHKLGIDVGVGIAKYNVDGILASAATLEYPLNVAIDGRGSLFISEYYRIRKADKR